MSDDPPIPPIDWDQRLADFIASRQRIIAERLAIRTQMHERRQAGLARRHARKIAYNRGQETDHDRPETTGKQPTPPVE